MGSVGDGMGYGFCGMVAGSFAACVCVSEVEIDDEDGLCLMFSYVFVFVGCLRVFHGTSGSYETCDL